MAFSIGVTRVLISVSNRTPPVDQIGEGATFPPSTSLAITARCTTAWGRRLLQCMRMMSGSGRPPCGLNFAQLQNTQDRETEKTIQVKL